MYTNTHVMSYANVIINQIHSNLLYVKHELIKTKPGDQVGLASHKLFTEPSI